MLAKKLKLTGKDVRFLLRKKGLIYGKGMVFVVYPQYADRHFNQRSIQVSTKISGSSVKRNMIKRVFFDALQKDLPSENSFNGKYYKIFVYFHKGLPEVLTKLLANEDKNTIKSQIAAHFHEHFILFPEQLCRFSESGGMVAAPSRTKAPIGKTQKRENLKK